MFFSFLTKMASWGKKYWFYIAIVLSFLFARCHYNSELEDIQRYVEKKEVLQKKEVEIVKQSFQKLLDEQKKINERYDKKIEEMKDRQRVEIEEVLDQKIESYKKYSENPAYLLEELKKYGLEAYHD